MVQGKVGELAVAGETLPFPVEGGEHLRRGWVQQARVGGLGLAVGVDGVQRGGELGGGPGVCRGAWRGGRHRGARGVERPDALDPAVAQGRQCGVGVAGADEVAPDVDSAPEVVDPLKAAQ